MRAYLRLAFAACLLAAPASAATITLTHSGTAPGGSLDGVAFGPTPFSITAIADPVDRITIEGGFNLPHRVASIQLGDLSGISLASTGNLHQFRVRTRTFVNNDLGLIGFGRFADLFDGPTDDALKSYDFLSSIGPISGTGRLLQWLIGNDEITTSAGRLIFNDGGSPATFRADFDPDGVAPAPIPLPAAAWLILAGLGALGLIRAKARPEA